MGVISELRNLRTFVKTSGGSPSLLAYQVTACVIFMFSLLVSSLQYFGEPIQCVQDEKEEDAVINERVMNTFCFISNTYTVTQDHLGYGCDGYGLGPNGMKRRQSYYIWIPYILFFQAGTFLIPYSYWRYCEGGLIRKLLSRVTGIAESREERQKHIAEVSSYFHKRLGTHQHFVFAWVFFDFLGFIIVIGNCFLTDALLGGLFADYGARVLSFGEETCNHPMEDAFPKVTKCTFHKFGPGGSVETYDSLCVMALNVVNEKIYFLLWVWFILLMAFSALCCLLKIGR